MNPATTLREAFQATDPRPLKSGDPYFVDLSAARNSSAAVYLRQMIENCASGRYSAIAFTGHRGSGKSTELRQLQQALSATCFGLYLDVEEFLDVSDVDYTDLLLLLSKRLLEKLHNQDIHLSTTLLEAVEEWFKSVTKETEQSLALSAGANTEAEAGIHIPFLTKLLAKLTADIKAGSSTKKSTREELDRYFSGLLTNANLLLKEASLALQRAGRPAQVLVLLDNLDRMDPEKSEKLFFTHGSQLQDLDCHAVYTVPIDTFYAHAGLHLVFPNHVLLPNIKLQQSQSDPKNYQPGFDAMTEVIRRRVDVGKLMSDSALATEAIRLSGGSVRQLIRLLREAVLNTQARKLGAIDMQAIKDAARSLQQDFQRSLEEDDYVLLTQTAKTGAIKKNDAYMRLLRNTAIMEYNGGDVWYNVNPLIEPIHAYQATQKTRGGSRPRPSRKR